MEEKTLIGILLFAFVVLLYVAVMIRDQRTRAYRSLVSSPEDLILMHFEMLIPVSGRPEFFIRGQKLPEEDGPFVIADMEALRRKGFTRQVDYLRGNKVIPLTPDFLADIKECEERERVLHSIKVQKGEAKFLRARERVARKTLPYTYRRERYVAATKKRPTLHTRPEPTFV